MKQNLEKEILTSNKIIETNSDDLTDLIANTESELKMKISQIKSLVTKKDELEKKFMNKKEKLIAQNSRTKQLIEAKSANLVEVTDKLENYAIKKDDNKKDIDEVNLQLKLLKQKKASLILEQKSINVNITKLESEKESVQSDIERETTASENVETQIKTDLDNLEEQIKSVNMNIEDIKDCKEPFNQAKNKIANNGNLYCSML